MWVDTDAPMSRGCRRNPYRIATKHAHSQLNPERLWGEFTLKGIEFAFWALNDHFDTEGKRRFDRKNTIVIAAGASNGGGMALRALEDDEGLIDGPVVTEPNIGPEDGRFVIRFGTDAPFDPAGTSIYDSMTLISVYAPCAVGRAAEPLYVPEAEGTRFRRHDRRAGRLRAGSDPCARLCVRAGLGYRLARVAEPLALAAKAGPRQRLWPLRSFRTTSAA